MLWQIFSFEVRYWLRSWMLWIFFLLITTMIFFATATDHLTLGDALTNTYRNAPFVIQNFYSFMGLFAILMATAFVNSAASRDFNFNTFQIIFSTPMRRFDFLVGRFLGATLVSLIPILGVSAGIIIAKWMPWIQPERWGPIAWKAHLYGILVFALPNALILASILFAIAVLARNEIAAFVGAIALLVLYASTDGFLTNVDRQKLGAILDPFGIRTYAYITRYWTVADKNTLSVDYSGYLLWNRLLWIVVALAIFAFAYHRFSFTDRKKKSRAQSTEPSSVPVSAQLPKVAFRDDSFAKYRAAVSIHFWGVAKSTVFIVILLLALSNCVPALAFNATQLYGNSTFPVTYWVLDIIAGTFYMFLVAIITYFAGLLVWKDRDTGMDEIIDSQPSPEWVFYASRLTALIGLVFIILAVVMAAAIVVQAALGYHRFQLALYVKELFLRDGSLFLFLAILAFLIHVLSPNKYLGYFFYITFLLANLFIWRPLNVATNLVKFANRPRVLYSDFFHDAPFRAAWNWYAFYWLFFCTLLAIASVMLWPRGKQAKWSERFGNARLRFSGVWPVLFVLCFLAFSSVGAWAYYNTKVLNRYVGPKDLLRLQAEYEKTYKPLAKTRMPR